MSTTEPQAWAAVTQALAAYLEVAPVEFDWDTVDWFDRNHDDAQNWLDQIKSDLIGALEDAIDNKTEQARAGE